MSQQELNADDNLQFIFDVSYSMNEKDTPSGATRLDYAKEKAIALANSAVKYDPDGVEIGVFGKGAKWIGKATAENAGDLIGNLKPTDGQTDTHLAIRLAYESHVANGNKQTFCFLVTDGEPSDRSAVRNEIAGIADKLKDEHEFCIGILSVGDLDKNPSLKAFLTELDDTLKAKHDIVDVTALEEAEDLIQIATKALHD
jgi:Mg-chelatase subunit ChlD